MINSKYNSFIMHIFFAIIKHISIQKLINQAHHLSIMLKHFININIKQNHHVYILLNHETYMHSKINKHITHSSCLGIT